MIRAWCVYFVCRLDCRIRFICMLLWYISDRASWKLQVSSWKIESKPSSDLFAQSGIHQSVISQDGMKNAIDVELDTFERNMNVRAFWYLKLNILFISILRIGSNSMIHNSFPLLSEEAQVSCWVSFGPNVPIDTSIKGCVLLMVH